MADLPSIYDILNVNFLTQGWTAMDGVNRNAAGALVGALPEAQSANRPTAEWRNGVIGVLRQLSQIHTGATETTALNIATTLRIPRYTTAGRPAAGTIGRLIYDTDMDTILVDDGAAWDDMGAGSGAARSVLGVSGGAGTRADIAGNGTAFATTVLSDNGTSLAFRSIQSIAGSDVLYEVDFSSLATNAFSNGTEVIDGLSWTVANSAGAGSSWGVVNGQGIQWSAPTSSAQTWTIGAPNSPYLYLPVSSIPNWQGGYPIIIDLYLSAFTFENGNDCVRVGLWDVIGSPAAGSTTNRARIADRGNNGGTQTVRTFDGTTVTANADTWNVNAISCRIDMDNSMSVGVGTYSGGWPAFNHVQRFATTLSTDETVNASTARLTLIFINSSDASPTSAVTIARMRVRRG